MLILNSSCDKVAQLIYINNLGSNQIFQLWNYVSDFAGTIQKKNFYKIIEERM